MPPEDPRHLTIFATGVINRVRALRARLVKGLEQRAFVRNVGVLAGGTLFGQLITFAVAPLLTRLYTPEDFGILAIYTSILGVLTALACAGFELAIPLPRQDREAEHLFVISMAIPLIVGAILGLLLRQFGAVFVEVVNAPQLQPYLWLVPIGLIGVGFYQTLTYWAIRKGAFSLLAQTRTRQGFVSALIQVGSGIIGLSPLGLLLGQLANQTAGIHSLWRLVPRHMAPIFARQNVVQIVDVVKKHRAFPLLMSWSSALNRVGTMLPPILFAVLYGPVVAGLLAISDRVAKTPVNLVANAVSQVYFSKAAEVGNENRSELWMLAHRTAKVLLLTTGPLFLIVALVAPSLFAVLFGKEWRMAGMYLRAMSLMYMAQIVVSPLARTLIIVNRQGIAAVFDSVRAVAVVAAILIPGLYGATVMTTLLSYVAVMIVGYVIFYLLVRWSLRAA